jgi:hypothetical protein
MKPPGPAVPKTPLASVQKFGALQFAALTTQSVSIDPAATPTRWKIEVTATGTQPFAVDDLYLVIGYDWASP